MRLKQQHLCLCFGILVECEIKRENEKEIPVKIHCGETKRRYLRYSNANDNLRRRWLFVCPMAECLRNNLYTTYFLQIYWALKECVFEVLSNFGSFAIFYFVNLQKLDFRNETVSLRHCFLWNAPTGSASGNRNDFFQASSIKPRDVRWQEWTVNHDSFDEGNLTVSNNFPFSDAMVGNAAS